MPEPSEFGELKPDYSEIHRPYLFENGKQWPMKQAHRITKNGINYANGISNQNCQSE
jgi:hypothetical protein